MPGSTSLPRCLIWDFDGTLAHRPGLWSRTLLQVARRHAGRELDLDTIRPYLQRGFPWHEPEREYPSDRSAEEWWGALEPLFCEAYRGCGLPADIAQDLATKVRGAYTDLSAWSLFDDTVETLELLRREGWRHAILSNHVPELPRLVEGLGLGSLIGCTINSAVTGFEKPHPRAFQAALSALGRPEEVWMIGDNVVADVLGAEAAGLRAILVRADDPRAMRRAASLRSIRAFLP